MFAVLAVASSIVAHVLGPRLWPNVATVFVFGCLGTIIMVYGDRSYMVGWVIILWAIIAPLFDSA